MACGATGLSVEAAEAGSVCVTGAGAREGNGAARSDAPETSSNLTGAAPADSAVGNTRGAFGNSAGTAAATGADPGTSVPVAGTSALASAGAAGRAKTSPPLADTGATIGAETGAVAASLPASRTVGAVALVVASFAEARVGNVSAGVGGAGRVNASPRADGAATTGMLVAKGSTAEALTCGRSSTVGDGAGGTSADIAAGFVFDASVGAAADTDAGVVAADEPTTTVGSVAA